MGKLEDRKNYLANVYNLQAEPTSPACFQHDHYWRFSDMFKVEVEDKVEQDLHQLYSVMLGYTHVQSMERTFPPTPWLNLAH